MGHRQVGRPKKDPSTILNKRFSFLTNLKQFSLIDAFEDKGQSIREIIFKIMPAMIDKFISEDLEMNLSNEQWDIIEKITKWGE
ncbi:MAG: hypothetical protein [Thorarchaeia virus VerdaV2]|uniref:Uncharacterized protein n=1 Tax=Thorarchaeia virus VerdaV2 TaxID=3070171 RepID=A0AA35CQY3_9CAUD|nr:MAG: hypothetical protein QIT42_gp18 [Thorarchaeia virus VerdaV2]BDI54912.1 MAG: hypothetical protein [Thorarchaeia virus VerdaV2]